MPRKTFTAGEVLTATNVNTFLMDQTVMTFADSTARGSAIGTAIAQEGMLTYLEDTDGLELWNGTAWVSATPASGGSDNAVINGAFEIWQRGTSFTTTGNTSAFTSDRWQSISDGTGNCVVSRQTFTPGAAPVAGYEGTFFLRQQINTAGTSAFHQMMTFLEDVRLYAGQTATFSFYAKANSARTSTVFVQQNFGSGGSATVNAVDGDSFSLTTSWQRFTFTFAMPSLSGKTIGTNSFVGLFIRNGSTTLADNIDIWGVQLEAGSTATDFRRNANSIQGELAACQRYYYASNGQGTAFASTAIGGPNNFKVSMRAAPTMTLIGLAIRNSSTGNNSTTTTPNFDATNEEFRYLFATSWSPSLSTGMSYDFGFTASAEL